VYNSGTQYVMPTYIPLDDNCGFAGSNAIIKVSAYNVMLKYLNYFDIGINDDFSRNNAQQSYTAPSST